MGSCLDENTSPIAEEFYGLYAKYARNSFFMFAIGVTMGESKESKAIGLEIGSMIKGKQQ